MLLRYSDGNLIRGPADLDKVNQKLLDFGYLRTHIGSVTSGKAQMVNAKHPSPSRPDFLHVDEPILVTCETLEQLEASSTLLEFTPPELLNIISPDSNIVCESSDCPIKGITHNLGRYFHDGKQYQSPSAPGYEATLAGIMEDVSDSFNRTVLPPEVVNAYIRILYTDKATQADLHIVRVYKKHHVWSQGL